MLRRICRILNRCEIRKFEGTFYLSDTGNTNPPLDLNPGDIYVISAMMASMTTLRSGPGAIKLRRAHF
uniref:Uncharacterized protein n=1 Tax=Magallana gigas TaxID=29159 RepID=K1R2F0_MAGGI